MLKRFIGLSLLCVAGYSYADDIRVTTTDDIDADDNKCSLREAIELTNMKTEDGTIPKTKYKGCEITDPKSATVVLESGKTYKLNKEIKITKSIGILSLPAKDSSEIVNYKGEKNAVIKAIAKSRIFNIEHTDPKISSIAVTISEVDLVGCAASVATSNECSERGGIIYSNENLSISYSRISDGHALSGGAIFNDGVADSTGNNNTDAAGVLKLDNVLFSSNISNGQGAAVYSSQPRYTISNSVFKGNKSKSTLVDASVVYVNNPVSVPPGTDEEALTSKTASIINSVFFNNDAFAANLRDAMYINNSTIVNNKGGVFLNAQSGVANLSNSIVAGNTAADCKVGVPNKATTNNLVFSTDGCNLVTNTTNPNIKLDPSKPEHKLFANTKIGGGSKIEGDCDTAENNGLLCPYKIPKDTFLGFFKPRLLTTYNNLADSLIVNRGSVDNSGTLTNSKACAGTDQRGVAREVKVLCDIGSIELQINTSKRVGKDIRVNEIAEIDISDNLGDGQLWPADKCTEQLGAPTDGKPWQPGCFRFVEGAKSREGNITLSADALLKYTPIRSNFHGLDSFTFNVLTTTSHFSDGLPDQSIEVNGAVQIDPNDSFENKTVKTSGGSVGLAALFGLFGLAWMRRRLQGE